MIAVTLAQALIGAAVCVPLSFAAAIGAMCALRGGPRLPR